MQEIISKAARRATRIVPTRLREAVKEHRAAGRSMLVSVVVPVYNVEEYLAECLESILSQTHRRLEVVVVDDGSPDRSIDVARRFADQDNRVRIVRQANAGLGAARNTGARHARGQMICFVDSDDTIPPTSIETMLRSLVSSGSDFAVGSLVRDTSDGRFMPPWARKLHATTRQGLRFSDDPEVLKNVFAWTKLYRTEFFRRVVREFPDGLYEDQVPAARAYLHGTFDVLSDVVCYWRIRDDGTSITQQKSTMKDLVGRWTMLDELAEEMKDAPADLLRAWQVKTVGFDMRPYYEQVPRTPAEYWEFLQGRVRHFVDEVGYDVLAEVPVSDRLLAAATYHGHRDDLAVLVQRKESQTWKLPGHVVDGRPVVQDRFFDELALAPDEVVASLERDAEVRGRTDLVRIEDRTLVVEGSAHLANVTTTAGSDVSLRLFAVDDAGGRVEAAVELRDDPAVDAFAKDPWNEHAQAGFTATLDLGLLERRSCTLEVEVTVDGWSATGSLPKPDYRGRGRMPVFDALGGDGRWCLERQSDTGLVLRRLTANRVPVRAAELDGTRVRLTLDALPAGATVLATSTDASVEATVTADGTSTVAELDLGPWVGEERSWVFAMRRARSTQSVRLSWAEASASLVLPRGTLGATSTSQYGNVTLETGPVVSQADEVLLTDGGLEVTGWCTTGPGTGAVSAVLVGGGTETAPVPVEVSEGGAFRVVIPLVDRHGIPMPSGPQLALSMVVDDVTCPVRIATALWSRLPVERDVADLRAEVTASPRAALAVALRPPFEDDARGRRHQQLLIDAYRATGGPLQDAALFEAFGGRTVGDSPLALSRELHRTHPEVVQYWSVADLRTSVPEWATPVLRYSRPWFEALGGSRLLVNNNNWPWYFTKRPGQVYVQTWHGTPLKRIGNHVPDANLSITYRRLMEREAAWWDLLLAQNDYSAKIFPEAFGFAGDVVVAGYPRNDSLVGADAEDTRHRVREQLGLAPDTHVVLYAPTWRDNLRTASQGYGRVSYLDAEQLPAGTVVLYRGHANTAGATTTLPGTVIDVTRHPDVNELMLASDALVTDYSSIMFDYAVLRRPIYFLVPDLELYSGTTRGFYRDLADLAPGPLCDSTPHLVEALSADYWAAHGGDYDAFVAEFVPHDDGAAASRVLAHLFTTES
ncbi:CDP-glycerol glycerophosphotransferase [Isoptericola jiangsuensis]|uniref:CDP-glycerol glycerophosphotransferase n=1 Tax=Isoptericola jiangsuensis TaxID=548579 RepID=A0A2A9EZT3_9MICO|nr:CDP-glycerol glycerophosphotransferase family protein [Isoptericola jiangsuensis]PFG44051.1 CDP-glycerol glycerophosphotransferase [Isoptericola jiangsuensis]